jgi:hypothetical protein
MCLTDEGVIVMLVHEMAHALQKIQFGYCTHHTAEWVELARLYAEALDIPRIALPVVHVWVNMATIHRTPGTSGDITASTNAELERPPTIVIDKNMFLLQEHIQELIPTLSVVKKTILESSGAAPATYSTTDDLTAELEVRGVNLRANLCNVFQTYGTVPLHYLFSAIDAYTTCGYLREHDIILDTTTAILLPDRAGAYAAPAAVTKVPTSSPVASVSVIIDLNKCKDDKEVLMVLGHQMSHAYNYLMTGIADRHDFNWWQSAELYAVALGIPDIAYQKSMSCFQVKQLITL